MANGGTYRYRRQPRAVLAGRIRRRWANRRGGISIQLASTAPAIYRQQYTAIYTGQQR